MEPPIWLADDVRVIRTAVCDFVCVDICCDCSLTPLLAWTQSVVLRRAERVSVYCIVAMLFVSVFMLPGIVFVSILCYMLLMVDWCNLCVRTGRGVFCLVCFLLLVCLQPCAAEGEAALSPA